MVESCQIAEIHCPRPSLSWQPKGRWRRGMPGRGKKSLCCIAGLIFLVFWCLFSQDLSVRSSEEVLRGKDNVSSRSFVLSQEEQPRRKGGWTMYWWFLSWVRSLPSGVAKRYPVRRELSRGRVRVCRAIWYGQSVQPHQDSVYSAYEIPSFLRRSVCHTSMCQRRPLPQLGYRGLWSTIETEAEWDGPIPILME